MTEADCFPKENNSKIEFGINQCIASTNPVVVNTVNDRIEYNYFIKHSS